MSELQLGGTLGRKEREEHECVRRHTMSVKRRREGEGLQFTSGTLLRLRRPRCGRVIDFVELHVLGSLERRRHGDLTAGSSVGQEWWLGRGKDSLKRLKASTGDFRVEGGGKGVGDGSGDPGGGGGDSRGSVSGRGGVAVESKYEWDIDSEEGSKIGIGQPPLKGDGCPVAALFFNRVGTLLLDEKRLESEQCVDVMPVATMEDSMDTSGCESDFRIRDQACTSAVFTGDDVYDIYRVDETNKHPSQMPSRTRVVLCGSTQDTCFTHADESDGDASSRQTRQSEATMRIPTSVPSMSSQHQPMEQIDVEYASTPEENYVFDEYGERDGYEDDDEGYGVNIRIQRQYGLVDKDEEEDDNTVSKSRSCRNAVYLPRF